MYIISTTQKSVMITKTQDYQETIHKGYSHSVIFIQWSCYWSLWYFHLPEPLHFCKRNPSKKYLYSETYKYLNIGKTLTDKARVILTYIGITVMAYMLVLLLTLAMIHQPAPLPYVKANLAKITRSEVSEGKTKQNKKKTWTK